MAKITVVQEVVQLIRQRGVLNQREVRQHLPHLNTAAITTALEDACQQQLLTEVDGLYKYTYESLQTTDEEHEPSSIVEHALRCRSALELSWCGALA